MSKSMSKSISKRTVVAFTYAFAYAQSYGTKYLIFAQISMNITNNQQPLIAKNLG
jgi:hypothetical protein